MPVLRRLFSFAVGGGRAEHSEVPVPEQLAHLVDERAWPGATRADAICLSVVSRARDIVCGTLAQMPITRARGDEDLGPGWLARPDPTRTRAWFVAWITDDLFFRGEAFARVTSRDTLGRPHTLHRLSWDRCAVLRDGANAVAQLTYTDYVGATVELSPADLVIWESPLLGVLNGNSRALAVAGALDAAASRYAAEPLAACILRQTGGEPMSPKAAEELLTRWRDNRKKYATGFLNSSVEYDESTMDPTRLQLVEARSFQGAELARVCNLPAFTVGVGVPHESLTYKNAYTARLDTLDFGLAPIVECWEQTLSACLPHGVDAVMDDEPFLRTDALRAFRQGDRENAP